MHTDASDVPPRYGEQHGLRAGPALIATAAIVSAGAVLFAFDPNYSSFYPFCAFYRMTGLLCPGCGCLRALHQLLHGHVLSALHYNSLLVLSLPVLGWFGVRSLVRRVRGGPPATPLSHRWLWGGLAVLILFWILRNLPFGRTAWLAPLN